jgi:hypothetical protein
MLLAAGTWFSQQIHAWEALRPQWGQDLAFFHQIVHHAISGRPWTSPLLLEPTGFFKMVHFHPIFALVVPVYAVFRVPEALLALNVLAVVATAWPLALLGKTVSRSAAFGVASGVAWLLWVPAACAARADFRPMVFLIPGLAWVLVGVWRQRRAEWVGGALLCMLAREESAYLLLAGGMVLCVLPLHGPRRREGLGLLGMGAVWMAFLLAFKENFFFHFDPLQALPAWSQGPAVDPELVRSRAGFLLQAWWGGYLGAPLVPAPLAFGLGPLAWLCLDPLREWHAMTGTTVYLRDPLLPLIAVSGTAAAGWLVQRRPRWMWGVAGVLVLGNGLSFPRERARLAELYSSQKEEGERAELQALWKLIDSVPPDARVATDYRLVAALSGRSVLWNVAHLYMDDGRPHHWSDEWPLTLDRVDTVVVALDDPFTSRLDAWELLRKGGGYGLWVANVPVPDP